jgi:hypothetical protein
VSTSTNFRTIHKQDIETAYNLISIDQRNRIQQKYQQMRNSKGIEADKLKNDLVMGINELVRTSLTSTDFHGQDDRSESKFENKSISRNAEGDNVVLY